MSINDVDDIRKIDLVNITWEKVGRCVFSDLEVAYQFYCKYARRKGFAVRKGKVVKNSKGEIVQRTLFCNRQGKRTSSGTKKREAKPETRCECLALLCVRKDLMSGGWYVKIFNDDHNHDMLENKYCGMMPAHRKMTESDIMEMKSMRSVGISVPDIYASFASRCGGYDKVGFRKQDMYNQIDKQRRFQRSDAKSVLRCMFAHVEVAEFCRRWRDMVCKFKLEDNNWVKDLYEKKHMWATAYITGQFFAGLRTTSRCESLHGQLGRFIKSRYSLTEFVQHFQRSLCYMRYKEEEDDFASMLGEVVLTTNLQPLERSASRHFTRKIFLLFRKVLSRATQNFVVHCRQSAMWVIYTVKRYQSGGKEWYVSLYPPSNDFKCSCQRMESYGLPCPHIIAVLVYLDYSEIPTCLILERWTKRAKESICHILIASSHYWDSSLIARYASLLEQCRQLCNLVARCDEEFNRIKEWITFEIQRLKDKYGDGIFEQEGDLDGLDSGVLDPVRVRTKGCPRASSSVPSKGRRKNKCSRCGGLGHNKKCCPQTPIGETSCAACGMGGQELASQSTFDLYVDLHCGSPLIGLSQVNYQSGEGCSNARGS
ncbi:Zinc finger, CCHC-type [Sesbania bispinosa]|nr:Zinc finger, CCHC-type [Sesbania bispinosa]